MLSIQLNPKQAGRSRRQTRQSRGANLPLSPSSFPLRTINRNNTDCFSLHVQPVLPGVGHSAHSLSGNIIKMTPNSIRTRSKRLRDDCSPNYRAFEVVPRKRIQLTMKIMDLLLVVLDPRGTEDHLQSIRRLLLMLTQQLLQIRAKGGN